MKTMLHKPLASFMLVVAMVALALAWNSPAQAGPLTVVNATGTAVYSASPAVVMGFQKNTDSGNRTAVLYSSGWQYVADTATWSKHAEFVTKCGSACVAVDGSATGLHYNPTLSNGTVCWSTGTVIPFPERGAAEQVLGDSCAYWTKLKAQPN
jgi:hypothetical protein